MSLYSDDFMMQMMDGNLSEVNTIAKMFVDLGSQMLEDIRQNIDTKDWKSAGATAHKLKSSLKMWRMEELIPLSEFIEHNCENISSHGEIVVKFDILNTGLNAALDQMRNDFNL